MDVNLRPACIADADAVATVLISSRDTYLPSAASAHSPSDVRAWVAERLIPPGRVTVAVTDGAIVGVLAVSQRDGAAWIDQLYVSPAYVGSGVGSRLLAHAHATLPRPIRLWTFQPNYGARTFYERHGYRAVLFTDGRSNEERCPDVLYELAIGRSEA